VRTPFAVTTTIDEAVGKCRTWWPFSFALR
jgi:hypothetical protein